MIKKIMRTKSPDTNPLSGRQVSKEAHRDRYLEVGLYVETLQERRCPKKY
jgi:hypothetical protein